MSTSGRTSRAGFTLIEMMAVLVIISILSVFVLRTLMGGQKMVEAKATRGFISQLSATIAEYEVEFGRYPPSTFPADLDPKPSTVNMGAEMLVIALYPRDGEWQAIPIDEERLGNSDGDTTRRSLTSFTNADAFEMHDNWENPIAYIHRRDYQKGIVYLTSNPESGEEYEAQVKGALNPKTGDPYNKSTFQLISAGPDGEFGTFDDVANFK